MKTSRILSFALAGIAALLVASCATPKKVVYLQDMEQNSQVQMENKIQAVIVPYDELDIIISCPEPEIARPFNLRSASGTGSVGSGVNGQSSFTYLVDPDGNIQMPVLGELHVAGLTRLQLQDLIANILVDGSYLSDPFVQVRFYNFRVFFLGSDGGKSINIPNERCTFLEALALSGDLTAFTRRDKIGVLREIDGKMTMHYIDPRSSDVFNDPFFILQKNDIIVTRSFGSKYWKDEATFWNSWVSLGTSFASLATTLFLVFRVAK